MATPYNAPYKKAQRRARGRRGTLTPSPTVPGLAVKIGGRVYVSADHKFARGAFWVRME